MGIVVAVVAAAVVAGLAENEIVDVGGIMNHEYSVVPVEVVVAALLERMDSKYEPPIAAMKATIMVVTSKGRTTSTDQAVRQIVEAMDQVSASPMVAAMEAFALEDIPANEAIPITMVGKETYKQKTHSW
jgi:hypothetical protein